MDKVPTIELFKDGCRIVANVSDAKHFTDKGWAPKPSEKPEPNKGKGKNDPPAK